MNKVVRYLRAGAVMGLLWAIGGAAVGGVMEAVANFVPSLNAVDMWIQLFAIMGFLGGAAFSVVLPIAARRRKLEELSLGQFGLWGAIGGVLVGGLFVASGTGAFIVVPMTLLSTLGATGSLALARLGPSAKGLNKISAD